MAVFTMEQVRFEYDTEEKSPCVICRRTLTSWTSGAPFRQPFGRNCVAPIVLSLVRLVRGVQKQLRKIQTSNLMPAHRLRCLTAQRPVKARPANTKRLSDGCGPHPIGRQFSYALPVNTRLASLAGAVDLAMPSSYLSRRRLVSNSANIPSISRKALPAALAESMGGSVARSVTPRCFSSCSHLVAPDPR